MTISIYQNEFVFEKHGQHFSDYIAICIRNFRNNKSDNTECHHIIPKCMSGGKADNRRCNKVNLEFELHQEVHQLLAKAFPKDIGLKQAATFIGNRKCQNGKNAPFWKKSHSIETRQKQSSSHTGENNPMYGKTGENHHGYGRERSAETKAKISSKLIGRIPWNKGKQT